MKSAKEGFALTGAVLVIALGVSVAWREHGRAAAAIRTSAEIGRVSGRERLQRERLENRLAVAQRDLAAREAELAELARAAKEGNKNESASSPRGAATPNSASSAAGAKAPRQADIWDQSIRRDPALQALQIAADRARLAIDFEAFFRSRGMTAEQVARFQDITLRRDEAMADIAATIQSQGLAEDDPGIDRLQGAVFMAYKKEQVALLGADGFQQMRDHEPTISSRNVVRGLAAAALEAGIPFTPDQADELVRSLISSRSEQPGALWRKPDWNAVDAVARGFLTTAQLALIQNVETNVHGAGGRFWSDLTYLLEVTRQKDFETARKGEAER